LKEAKMMAGKRSCSFETLEVVESTFWSLREELLFFCTCYNP
jgi:hypothetical protein